MKEVEEEVESISQELKKSGINLAKTDINNVPNLGEQPDLRKGPTRN